jgi:hypothetical protein
MRLPPRHQPLAFMLAWISAVALLAHLGVMDVEYVIPAFFIALGVGLAAVQIRSGFTLRRASRAEDPFWFWAELVLNSVLFLLFGVFGVLVTAFS